MKTQKTDSEEKHAIIKARKEKAFEDIKKANELLDHLRSICEHPETELCTYMTRPGQYWDDTEICSICGEVVKWAYEGKDIKISTNDNKIASWDDGGCSTGLGGDQYEDWSNDGNDD